MADITLNTTNRVYYITILPSTNNMGSYYIDVPYPDIVSADDDDKWIQLTLIFTAPNSVGGTSYFRLYWQGASVAWNTIGQPHRTNEGTYIQNWYSSSSGFEPTKQIQLPPEQTLIITLLYIKTPATGLPVWYGDIERYRNSQTHIIGGGG